MIKKLLKNLKSPNVLIKKIYNNKRFSARFLKKDRLYWESLKGKYAGKRGFVIGNGPSLRMSDLDLLKNEITIASNKIYLAFDETNWRPSYYTVADPLVWEKVKSCIRRYFNKVHIPTYLPREDSKYEVYWKAKYMGLTKRFSNDMSNGAYSGQTVTFENIQFAVHLGLNPIYIIGCDHNYQGEKNVTAGVAIPQGEGQTHFTKNYRHAGELVLPAPIIDMEIAYSEAKKFCSRNGIKIFNATRGGNLEIFDRISFDGLFEIQ